MSRRWSWLLMAAAAGLLLWLGRGPRAGLSGVEPTFGQQPYVLAQVERVLQAEAQGQAYQVLEARVLEGPWANWPVRIEYGKYQPASAGLPLRPGDRIWVTLSQGPNGQVQAYFVDVARGPQLALLAGLFVLVIVLTSGWKGVRSLLAMAYSLAVIVYYIIPRILAGQDPVWVSISGSVLLLGVTLYFTYGWGWKTHAAVLSMVLGLALTGLLAWAGVDFTRLRGYGAEEALFLAQQAPVALNLRGLLLGGMIIGALGVLDDLVATQAAAVFELYAAAPHLPLRELMRRAMHIGQDHVAATVNTLVLAYAGTALPMLLLFSLGATPWLDLFNYEFVAEEVVRTLVGAIGLILTVPITTVVAALLARQRDQARHPWLRWLGPWEAGGHAHGHGHAQEEVPHAPA